MNEKRDKFKSKVLLKIYIQVKIKYKTEISQFTSTLNLLWREIYVYGN